MKGVILCKDRMPLENIVGRTSIIKRNIYYMQIHGVNDITIVTPYAHDYEALVGDKVDIVYDTGNGSYEAIRGLLENDTLLVLNGNVVTDLNLSHLINRKKSESCDAMLGIVYPDSPYTLITQGNGGSVVGIGLNEKMPVKAHAGVCILNKGFAAREGSYDSIDEMLETHLYERRIHSFLSPNVLWCPVKNHEQLADLRMYYRSRTDKPWGFEICNVSEQSYMMKELHIFAGRSTSLHKHSKKRETMVLTSGHALIRWDVGYTPLSPNVAVTIEPGTIHSIEARSNAIISEASMPYHHDTIRIKDQYGDLRE